MGRNEDPKTLNPATIMTRARGQRLPKMYPNPSFSAPNAGARDGTAGRRTRMSTSPTITAR